MKILHVPAAYAPVFGGAETQIQRVSECMVQMGHEVQIFTTDVSSVDGYYMALPPIRAPAYEVMNGVAITRVPFGSQIGRMAWTALNRVPLRRGTRRAKGLILARAGAKFAKALQEFIRIWSPDVVIAIPHIDVTNVQIVLRVWEVMKFPLVLIPLLHESNPDWSRLAVKTALKSADAVLANTYWEADRLCWDYDVSQNKIFVGGMGTDIVHSNERIQALHFTVTYLGRRSITKGIPLLLDAMRVVWETARDVDLIIAGAETKDEEDIQDLIIALPEWQRSRVISATNISESEKHAILNRSDLLVLASLNESFGGVLLEAWSRRVPVATLDLPIFREIVSDREDGLLLANTPQAFAECILFGYRNRAVLKTLGEVGYGKVSRYYKWEAVANRFLAAYSFAADVSRKRNL
jgi:glycosyltransferase involved in cell wall biosynthesis